MQIWAAYISVTGKLILGAGGGEDTGGEVGSELGFVWGAQSSMHPRDGRRDFWKEGFGGYGEAFEQTEQNGLGIQPPELTRSWAAVKTTSTPPVGHMQPLPIFCK